MFKTRYKSHHDVKDVITKQIGRRLLLPKSYWELLKSDPIDIDGGIYVHTPYCDKICSFCNMNRKQIDNNLDGYTDYLVKEIYKYKNKNYIQKKEFSAVFFGGGTPTIFKPYQLEKILSALKETFTLTRNCEFTFETTLHNLTLEKLEVMEKYGVNRLSIGIQTFSNRGRKLLNRTYDQEWVINRLEELKNRFKGLICIDLIYNYLGQTLEEIEQDAKIAGKISPDSISFYSLMIHEGSKISKDLNSGEKAFDYTLEYDKILHDRFLSIMKEKGYSLLEHTKVSKGTDGYRYIKNIHELKDLIPIGTGAGGRVLDMEIYNLNKFITFYSRDSEKSMKMKKLSGITQEEYVKFSKIEEIVGDNFNKILKIIIKLESKGYLITDKNGYKYTEKGIFWGNNISAKLVEELNNLLNI